MMTRENILRKIAALKNLAAADSGATSAERETALRLAVELIYKYGIRLHELGGRPQRPPPRDGMNFTWVYDTSTSTNSTNTSTNDY